MVMTKEDLFCMSAIFFIPCQRYPSILAATVVILTNCILTMIGHLA